MNQLDKINLLKDTIKQLRIYECKSINYISQLLKVDRKILNNQIKDWGYVPRNDKKGIKPSTQKFLNKNKQYILSAYNNNIPMSVVAKELGVAETLVSTINAYDDDLKKAFCNMKDRKSLMAKEAKQSSQNKSHHDYNILYFEGEEWKPILGYNHYEVSNCGRVRKYVKGYNSFYLLTPTKNSVSGRLYITLSNNNKKQNLQLARLVGFSFCTGYSKENNTINHKDGDINNNKANNLEWVSQSTNNKHSYNVLKRKVNYAKPIDYIIEYQGKYQFKTVAAFARFIGKSETQARRYINNPKENNITLIKKEHNCND
jgi:hypothetical protein